MPARSRHALRRAALFGVLALAACGRFTLSDVDTFNPDPRSALDAGADGAGSPPNVDAGDDEAPDAEGEDLPVEPEEEPTVPTVACNLRPGMTMDFTGQEPDTLAEHGWWQGRYLVSTPNGLLTVEGAAEADDSVAVCESETPWDMDAGIRIVMRVQVNKTATAEPAVLQLSGLSEGEQIETLLVLKHPDNLSLTSPPADDREKLGNLKRGDHVVVLALRRSAAGTVDYCYSDKEDRCLTTDKHTDRAQVARQITDVRFGLSQPQGGAALLWKSITFEALP